MAPDDGVLPSVCDVPPRLVTKADLRWPEKEFPARRVALPAVVILNISPCFSAFLESPGLDSPSGAGTLCKLGHPGHCSWPFRLSLDEAYRYLDDSVQSPTSGSSNPDAAYPIPESICRGGIRCWVWEESHEMDVTGLPISGETASFVFQQPGSLWPRL